MPGSLQPKHTAGWEAHKQRRQTHNRKMASLRGHLSEKTMPFKASQETFFAVAGAVGADSFDDELPNKASTPSQRAPSKLSKAEDSESAACSTSAASSPSSFS